MYVGDVRRHNGNTTDSVTYIDHVTHNGTVTHEDNIGMWTMLQVMLHIWTIPHMQVILIHIGIITYACDVIYRGNATYATFYDCFELNTVPVLPLSPTYRNILGGSFI